MAYVCCKTIQFDGSICFFTISHKKVIPDWDDLWGTIAHMGSSQTGMNMCCHEKLNNTQILINFKCTCFLCIATTGHTMFAWVAYVECGLMCVIPAWDDPHHSQSWRHGLDLLQNISIWWFNMFFHHKKVIPDWDGPPHPSLGWQSGACHVGCVGWIIKKYHFCPQSQKPIPVWDELDFTFVAWLHFYISASSLNCVGKSGNLSVSSLQWNCSTAGT